MALYDNKVSFTELREKSEIESNTTLSRDLDFLDSNGLIVNVFERGEDGHYSYYELNPYGRRIAEIVREMETMVEEKANRAIPA